MRQRIISAALGIPLVIVVLFFYQTPLLNIAMASVALMAIYEVFVATKYIENRGITIVSFVYAALIPFFHIKHLIVVSQALSFLFILTLFILLIANNQKMRVEHIGTVFMLTLLLSLSFSCIVYIRDIYVGKNIAQGLALFYIILVFVGAWITDAGAYFIGVFFGKTKFSPNISPKKTVEGAAGGIVSTLIFFFIVALIYRYYVSFSGGAISINFVALTFAAILSAVAAIIGDLSASLIKRQCHIKDFGNILPGHGGLLDRFDSVMFVAPLLFIYLQIFPIVR